MGSHSQTSRSCPFCDIILGISPASVVYKDEVCMAFMDIRPINAGHMLIVPLTHAACLAEMPLDTGGHLFRCGMKLAAALRKSDIKCEGVNLYLADGKAAMQEVFHVHLHVVPRFQGDGFALKFPPHYGQGIARERLNMMAQKIAAKVVTDSAGD